MMISDNSLPYFICIAEGDCIFEKCGTSVRRLFVNKIDTENGIVKEIGLYDRERKEQHFITPKAIGIRFYKEDK